MNRRTIFLFSFFVSLVLLALIVVQLYWITNAIKLTEQHFEQDVNDALNNVVYRLEKSSTAAKLTQKFNFRKQAIRWMSPPTANAKVTKMQKDSMDRAGYSISPNMSSVKVVEEVNSDTNGIVTGKMKRSYFSRDSAKGSDFSTGLKFDNGFVNSDSIDKTLQWATHRSDVMTDIFDELVSINVYHDVTAHTDTAEIDSLVRTALADQNIFIPYRFGILNTAEDTVVTASPGSIKSHLLQSQFKVNLSPKNVFIKPRYLSLYFPSSTNYSLSKLKIVLLSSVALIIIIIGAFYFTISTIFRQKKLSEIKSDFINNMTHEFKTPISTISLASEVLRDKSIEKSSDSIDRYLGIISAENKRLAGLVENVLQAAVLDQGKLKLRIEETDVHKIIENVLQSLNLQIQSKQGEITTSLQAQRYSLFADKMHLGNIIYNLVDNALKYCKEAPRINVSTSNTPDELIVSVSDNGIGIRKEDQKKIFETFYRVPTGNVHNVKGFGLGLSYVKAVVEKHGGHIEVESEPNKGSTFIVHLPFNTTAN
jgi:two-component system, OmpR family, phosphate regulon sensor histidine kinase PhoR